ncbi:hypothetical protein MPSEU_000194800 [Mayamaea pseudoterrestris]|nr:hypothetical protein MPSEU_000194800 [Mayamaea pseudoterrestris]
MRHQCCSLVTRLSITIAVLAIVMSLAKGFLGGGVLWGAAPRLSSMGSSPASFASSWLKALATNHTADKIHLIVLVHGWMGNPDELKYLQSAIEQRASRLDDHQSVLVYSVRSNEHNTSDGIVAGGTRVSAEVNEILAQLAAQATSELSVSFVGHSLGGLYARYSLSELQFEHHVATTGSSTRSVLVTPKIFCTTATPHLGVSGYTYLPLPRAAEYIVAHAMQPTGRDLFRFTNVLERMVTEPSFMNPLGKFAKRIAYACAHATDFQVPTATAAFLSNADTLHARVAVKREEEFVAVAVETEQRALNEPPSTDQPLSATKLAERLDALGWRKVFYDMRNTLPSLAVPFFTPPAVETSHKSRYTSAELLREYASWKTERIHFPMGHNILVANAKNEAYAKMNAAGQPVMDQLAAYLVQEITGVSVDDEEPGTS